MTLQEMLYGTFTPPPEIGHRVHRSLFAGEPRFIEPKRKDKPARDPNAMTASEELALKIMRRQKAPITTVEFGPLLKMSKNHAGILLTSLYRKGYLSRTQHRKPGTRYYKYSVKEQS